MNWVGELLGAVEVSPVFMTGITQQLVEVDQRHWL